MREKIWRNWPAPRRRMAHPVHSCERSGTGPACRRNRWQRAELSERTVRNLEAGRVRSPRNDTVRLPADAPGLTEPDRQGWFAAARGANDRRAEPALPGAGLPAQLPSDGPARPRLRTRGFDMGNNSRNHRSFTMKFRAEVVREFVVRASPCGLELARIEAVLTGDAQDASRPAVTCLIDWAGETPRDGVHRKTFDKLPSAR